MKNEIIINEQTEPKVLKSLVRIAEYYIRASRYITRYKKDYTEEIIYKKSIVKLPDKFRKLENDYAVLRVGKYGLQNVKLWTVNGIVDLSIKQLYMNVELECHIDEKGTLLAVFLVD